MRRLTRDIRIDLSTPGEVRLVDPADMAEVRRLAAENSRRAALRRRQFAAEQATPGEGPPDPVEERRTGLVPGEPSATPKPVRTPVASAVPEHGSNVRTGKGLALLAAAVLILAAGCGRPVGPVGHTELIPPVTLEAP